MILSVSGQAQVDRDLDSPFTRQSPTATLLWPSHLTATARQSVEGRSRGRYKIPRDRIRQTRHPLQRRGASNCQHANVSRLEASFHGRCRGLSRDTFHSCASRSQSLTGGQADAAKLASVVAGIPLGRIAEPSDIANAVAHLACQESSFITGQIIAVDGGRCI